MFFSQAQPDESGSTRARGGGVELEADKRSL